jgi:hypothetical protein
MSKTIINQGAATPLALLEAFRLVVACESEPLTLEDACHLLGPHGWTRLEQKKVDAWVNAIEDSDKPAARAEFEELGLTPPNLEINAWARWQESLALTKRLSKEKTASELPQSVALLLKSTSSIETVLVDSAPAPTVLRALIDLGVLGVRSRDQVLEISKAWKGAPPGVPTDWFFEKLCRYFFRAWNGDDRDYRLLARAYRAWLDMVGLDGAGELAILKGSMDARLFTEFNNLNFERLGISMNPDKLRYWVRAVCQMGLCWIVSKAESGTGEYERPFPDPSPLIEWCLDDIVTPGGDVPLDDFVSKFGRAYPVLDYSDVAVLPFGLSFALRALHDSGALELRFEGDARVKTRLSEDPAHRVPRANRVRRPK